MAHKSDARKKKKKLNTETAAIPNNGMEETDCRYQKKQILEIVGLRQRRKVGENGKSS